EHKWEADRQPCQQQTEPEIDLLLRRAGARGESHDFNFGRQLSARQRRATRPAEPAGSGTFGMACLADRRRGSSSSERNDRVRFALQRGTVTGCPEVWYRVLECREGRGRADGS